MTRLKKLAEEERTIILYESPHRLLKTLQEILEHFGDREMSVVRELTKKFEEVIRGRVSDVLRSLSSRSLKGEFVIVVTGKQG
jgi:16S rRNA (cytidine1402-2'-O)-methyltransferase